MTDAAAAAGPAGTADQRREQMLRAALEVIGDRGYADTRIADVAERIGISPALVIYYFKTKDQLLTEAIRYSEDAWYAQGQRRLAEIPAAAARIEEAVALNCLPEEDLDPYVSWTLWLDFWALAARNPEVAELRRVADERWRALIAGLVRSGQEAGEFSPVDADDFAITLDALLDGLAIQIALEDQVANPEKCFELCMLYISRELGFEWPGTWGRRGYRKAGPADQALEAQQKGR